VAYLGLNPKVRQSGGQPARHGRITKAGAAHARGMLVEAAWSASKAAGPLRAFDQRVQARRGMQIAAVATARKLAVLCWHLIIKGEDYALLGWGASAAGSRASGLGPASLHQVAVPPQDGGRGDDPMQSASWGQ
jgi:hypothetical protein